MARYFDAHNHLQDPRLATALPEIFAEYQRLPLVQCVVNGTTPGDWPAVAKLAEIYPQVTPSFGLHPWHVGEPSENWDRELESFLTTGKAAIGEIGLDRWIEGFDFPAQETAFSLQLRLAAERKLPVSIHCSKAWGRLLEMIRNSPPPTGFLLHSYGGPVEMIPQFVKLGGYFSLSGYFAHERKTRQREAFRSVPLERLLLETDAPDMLPPEEFRDFKLADAALNHPANIAAVYRFAARLLELPDAELQAQIEENFRRLFG